MIFIGAIKGNVLKSGYKKIIKYTLLGCAIIAFILIVIFFSVQIYMGQSVKDYIILSADDAPPADAVMVLGALVYNNSIPSPILQDRLDYALELYQKGKAQKILVSGDHGTKGYDEVNVMKNYLLEKGIPRENIFMDHAGFNTYDSMYRAKNIFQINSLLISTQNFHINRAIYIARNLGIDAYGFPSEDKKIYKMNYLNIRESLARIKAFVDVAIKRNPRYLGEVIPISGNGILTE